MLLMEDGAAGGDEEDGGRGGRGRELSGWMDVETEEMEICWWSRGGEVGAHDDVPRW